MTDTPRPRGRPSLEPDQETERVTLRLPARSYDELVTAAEELGITYAGRPSHGALARAIVIRWLELYAGDQEALEAWLR